MRPTDYSKDVVEKAKAYLASCIDEEREIMNADKLTTRLKVNLPSIEGLAVYLECARSTVYLWAKEYPEFSDILEQILTEQAKRLLSNGLSGDYNSTITKLILTKHTYHDKVDTDLTSGGEVIVPLTIQRGKSREEGDNN